MAQIVTKLGEGGRVVIPADYRRALDIGPGDEVILTLEDGAVKIQTPRQAVRRAQALVRRYVPLGRSLAGELIRERRKESIDE